MASPFIHRLRVRYNEVDAQGVVFNANYLNYFDVAFTEAWREAIGPYGELVESGFDFVVAEARARYRGGARFDEEIELRWWVESLGETSLQTRIDVVRAGDVLVEGEMRHVCVRAGTTEKVRIPNFVRTALEPYRSAHQPGSVSASPDPASRLNV